VETPDTTAAQIKAVLMWVFSFLALIGVGVSDAVQSNIVLVVIGFCTVALPTALVLADALIRRARAANIDAILRNRAGESFVNE
jgi:hypothetical protein